MEHSRRFLLRIATLTRLASKREYHCIYQLQRNLKDIRLYTSDGYTAKENLNYCARKHLLACDNKIIPKSVRTYANEISKGPVNEHSRKADIDEESYARSLEEFASRQETIECDNDAETENIIKDLKEKHGDLSKAEEEKFRQIISIALEDNISTYEISKAVKPDSPLYTIDTVTLKRALGFLGDTNFPPSERLKLISNFPKVASKNGQQRAEYIIDALRALGFTEGKLQLFVTNYPEVLGLKPRDIQTSFKDLLAIFRKQDILKLYTTTPNVLMQTWDELTAKIQYIALNMGVDQNKIIKTKALSKSLEDIRCRHMFLGRAGLYKKPHPKHRMETNINASLSKIIDTTDEEFATRVAKLSLAEYEAFKKIVKLEDSSQFEDESGSELESDSDREDKKDGSESDFDLESDDESDLVKK